MDANLSKVLENTAKTLTQQNRRPLPHAGEMNGMKHHIACVITLARQALYPQVFGKGKSCGEDGVAQCLCQMAEELEGLCNVALAGQCTKNGLSATEVTSAFVTELPQIKTLLQWDIQAAYEGDPAATSEEEILCAYPSFEALSIFRMAHALYALGVPLLPRMMTEYAHERTGIDIHPGACIGSHFFIDHGTGVVIGETCVIGHHVKLYQGVTLGAKSFPTDQNGNPIKGIQRHPKIGNGVVIYAGATILGGDTYIGNNAVIGGNVWLTSSVPDGAIVTHTPSQPKMKTPKDS